MVEQAVDFKAECDCLRRLLSGRPDRDFGISTQFKSWTVNDVLVHLHFWNQAADLSVHDPDAFDRLRRSVGEAFTNRSLREFENEQISERGTDLLAVWSEFYQAMAERFEKTDGKKRVGWVGPDMSVRSSITARQMETWAHGHEVFDLFGVRRNETDRIRNIVILGVNTFEWSFRVRGRNPPGPMPRLHLVSPSGEVWIYGENVGETIAGEAVEFCQVVTQTRNIADTKLEVVGPTAADWMKNAQCFAGSPETPPEPGSRHRQ